ncbi:LOW QUALITY PROTEIN: protein BOLA4, chloroplastic/mitochondrial [Argentina anserina]|uniref:LOW QUALITY PROTEIN: protein BOLA4, chloroplastic/mitochondrial n=1 Tax=Argentina anserina TaxID=57926 RepID=UPI0021767324|nr:LOW QUALITY PROTEIN: protein BOLA4, chloroplastic/mitochondrial [Potentilla anserina]
MVAGMVMVRPYVSASSLSRALTSAASALSRALPTLFAEPRKNWLVCETQSMKLLNDSATTNKHRSTRRLVFGSGRRFSTRATHISDAGSIGSPLMQSMENKIKEQLNAESVIVKDANGDGRHVSIDIVSSSFEGQSAVNRQRMVYKAIWEELQNTVHAVDQMTTKTPEEAATQK